MSSARPYGPAWWRARALARVEQGIAWYLPHAVRRALRRDLAGIWGREPAASAAGGAVVVVNHHSWWDGYLAWLVAARAQRPFAVLVDDATLERYPFFRRVGAVGVGDLRAAVRRATAGAWLFVFPEGRLGPAHELGPFAPGADAIARMAGVPVQPMAWRVVMRGQQYPEVYLRRGPALPAGAGPDAQRRAVAALIEALDQDLEDAADAEAPVPGYALLYGGRRSSQERVARWRRWWGA